MAPRSTIWGIAAKFENCALPGSYAACSGNSVHDISGQNIFPVLKFTLQNGADSLSRNVGMKLPLLAA